MIKKLLWILLVCFSSNARSQIINEKLVEKHLTTLADDLMEGRKAGSQGIEMAAKYIESEFERIGLDKFESQNSFRQSFSSKDMSLFNVIGVLEGKSKADEYVIISAHYDHLGMKTGEKGDLIFNGANDNASGVSAVLALAEHYKTQNINERSLLFVAFTAEEMGLIGSNYFGKQINPENIIAGINIEMIGKESPFGPKTAWLTGFDRSDFGQIIQKNLEESDYSLYPDPYVNFRLFFRSDNASLARLGVPAHTISTSPMDKDLDYHKVSDETKTLDLFTVSETIKAIAIGTLSIVNGNDTPSRIIMKKDEPFK
ncbi:MAG: M28 family peptidase [Flavobacteriales bacterium]|jgi:Zn-dependent M28 family amino/carboxypeptidase|tara:strand:- start:12770 stop:13711 length:942 start_codon:yes stop_codon:yes gene_type:complete